MTYGEGVVGQGAVFDGVDDFFDCGADPAFVGYDSLTIAMWINLEERDGVDQYVMISNLGIYTSSGGYQLHLGALPQGFTAVFRGDDYQDKTSQSEMSVAAGVWTHIAATYQGAGGTTTVMNYINGALDHTEVISAAINYDAVSSLSIGSNLDGVAGGGSWDREYQGGMDDVRIYDRALSDSEIQELYDFGN